MTTTNKVLDAYNKKKSAMNGSMLENEPSSKKVQRERAKAVTEKASQKSQDQVVKCLAELKVVMTESIDSISNQLTTEITTLREVQEAIEAEKAHLENLHGIVAEADSLQALILAQKDEKEAHEFTMQMAKDGFTVEKSLRLKDEQDRQKELEVTRKREAEEYVYETSKLRRHEEETFKAGMKARHETLEQEFDKKNSVLDLREAEITKREIDLQSLKDRVLQLEAATKGEVEKAVAIATNSLKKDLTNTHSIEKMGMQHVSEMKAAENARLQARIDELQKQNVELDSKYKAATDKVQQIAEKAIEGASKQAVVYQQTSTDTSAERNRK